MAGQTEQELRIQLAACYRIFDYLGWSEMIFNHITMKVPSDQVPASRALFNQSLRPPLQRSHRL